MGDVSKGANAFAAKAVDVGGLAQAARAAVVASYTARAKVKTGSYLSHLSVQSNRANTYRVLHYDVIAGDPAALSIEYGHEFRRRDGTPTGNRTQGLYIMTSAWATFPGVV